MLERFRAYIAEHRLISEGGRTLVGFSGGPDSTCLLHLMHRAKLDIVAAYLHHGQRAEANAERDQCRGFAESIGVPFVAGHADVPALAADRKMGIEEAGREARYAFFESMSAQTGCDQVATAHTRTDLAETVLLNLARGAGLGGLSGIPVRRDHIIRPLMFARRAETIAYCQEHGFATIHDPANVELTFSRARIRTNVVPELERINPEFEAAVARLAETAAEEDGFLDAAAAAALERCEIPLNGGLRFLTLDAEACFDCGMLRHLPPVLLKRAMRLVVEALGGRLDFSTTHEAALRVSSGTDGSLTSQEGQVVLTWRGNELHVLREGPFELPRAVLRIPGDTLMDACNARLHVALVDATEERQNRAASRVLMDLDGFRGPLHVRSFQPGDRMRPLGGNGHRKLSDLLGEAKLTLLARKRLPIICDIIGPVWAPGVALDERVRVAPGSTKALLMVFAPIHSAPADSETLSGV